MSTGCLPSLDKHRLVDSRNAEKVRQWRSHLESILNVAKGYASGAFMAAALLDKLFEHPAKA